MHDPILLQLIDEYFLPKGYRGAPDFIREFHDCVLPLITPMRIGKNTVLFTQHSIPNCIFFLLSGVAYSSMEHPLRTMLLAPFLWRAPAIIGDGRSFYKQKSARFAVAMQGNGMVYSLERKHLQLIEDKFPKVQVNIRLAIKQQQQAFKNWKDSFSHEKVPIRLQRLLEQDPALLEHVQQKHLAGYLGIYESYCSKLIKEHRVSLL